MVGEALDESVEGGAVRELVLEAADGAEVVIVLQAADQRVGMRQVQEERAEVGSPERF